MPKNPKQKLKLLYLYHILLQKTDDEHPLSMDGLLRELARHGIEAERKSIYDDIAALSDFGLDVLVRRGPHGGYFVGERTFELPELRLLVDFVQSSRFITERKSAELIGKIEALTSSAQASALQQQVFILDRVKTENESIYYAIDKLHDAIATGRQVSFLYFEWVVDFSQNPSMRKQFRKDGSTYTVSPWALTWDDENYYLVAHEPTSDSLRHYRVDKMEQLSILNQTRTGQAVFQSQYNIAAYQRKVFGMFSGEERDVVLHCENRFAGVLRDRFGSDMMLRPLDETHFAATVRVAVSPQFFSWVFGLSGGVRIFEPSDVKQKFTEHLRDMLK